MAMTADASEKGSPPQAAFFSVLINNVPFACSTFTTSDFVLPVISHLHSDGERYFGVGRRAEVTFTLGRLLIEPVSYFPDWIKSLNGTSIEKRDIVVSATNQQGTNTKLVYSFADCFPTSIKGSNFNASSTDFLMQDVTFTGATFDMSPGA